MADLQLYPDRIAMTFNRSELLYGAIALNPFIPFLMFSGARERVHWEQMG